MAGDYFLHLEDQKIGVVKGESVDPSFLDDIQLIDFVFAGMQHTDVASGQATGRATYSDVEMKAPSGGASAPLMQILAENGVIKVAKISFRKTVGNGTPQVFLTWEFTDGRITKFRQSPNEHGKLIDEFSLGFTKATLKVKRQKKDGSLEADRTATFDRNAAH